MGLAQCYIMKKIGILFFLGILTLSALSCTGKDNPIIPDDTSGISFDKTNVSVGYTDAKVYGTLRIKGSPERITQIRVVYGDSELNFQNTVVGSFDKDSRFSSDLVNLEDGKLYFYRVDIIVGRTPIEGTVGSFVTFPKGPVDLDLPSGKKWASHNLGASVPTDKGNYYAWGETSTKDLYNWSTYKYCNGDYQRLTKYTTEETYSATGIPDNFVNLQPVDDAATANMGDNWRTSTRQEWQELIDNTTHEEVIINEVRGIKISSKIDMNSNKKFIFVVYYPGAIDGTQFNDYGSRYWTATVNAGFLANQYAYVIVPGISGSFYTTSHSNRCSGHVVRAIYK